MTKSMVVSPVTSFIFISPKINLGLGRDGIRIFGNGSYKCLIKDILCSNHQLFSENYLQHFAKFLKNTLHILFFGIPCRSSLQKYFVMIVFLVSSIHLHISRWDVRTTYFQASDWTVELYKRILLEETETRTPLISVSCIESDILHWTCLFMNNSAWFCCLLSRYHQFQNLEIFFMKANMHVSTIKF